MKRICHIMVAVFLLGISETHAYELATHGHLTYQAFKQSILADPGFLIELGLENGKDPFGEIYYDINGNVIAERSAQLFEQQENRMPEGTAPLSIEGWLMRGAIREDDAKGERNPQDDPYNPDLRRPLHHFFDPINNRPLTRFGLWYLDNDVHKAPDWAIGGRDVFSFPNTPETGRRNHFTAFDAREAMYRALTGLDSSGNEVALAKKDRDKYWATTFRALGDIVHLAQDMAQPQHTRNDAHAGRLFAGHMSIYEAYIEARATGAKFFTIDGEKITPGPLNYSGYAAPAFTKYGDFWSTRTGITGGGLADYSNRGFFSAGTNLGSNDYPSPSNDPTKYTRESTLGSPLGGASKQMYFLRGDVFDFRVSGKSNIRMTTEDLFDAFLTKPRYSLNRLNYDDMANLLIPRAVGYSAGLINYFFRGKLDFVKSAADPAKYVIKNLGQEAMVGTFTLYYDDAQSTRHQVSGANWVLSIPQGAQSTALFFTPPTNPAPRTSGEYMLVFRGALGQETDAVVGHRVKGNVDQRVIVGYSDTPVGNRAFRWTADGGMVNLGLLPGGLSSAAHGVSANGAVVVGQADVPPYYYNRAFRWTEAGGVADLGVLSGNNWSMAWDVSSDGAVVVGNAADYANYYDRAFRWTEASGMVDLGGLPGGNNNKAFGVSADGAVVVGQSHVGGYSRAFRWTEAGGMQDLGTLPGRTGSIAWGVSADGNVVVGESYLDGARAFRWTAAGGMEDLGVLPDYTHSWAYGVSADGSTVVGSLVGTSGNRAFRWTAAGGMEDLGVLPGGLASEALAVN